MQPQKPQQERVIRERERREITGIPTSTWYVMQDEGRAPRPVPISERGRGWLLSEINDFLQQRIAARDAKHGDTWASLGSAAAKVVAKARPAGPRHPRTTEKPHD
jgi:prophage regulatory protein